MRDFWMDIRHGSRALGSRPAFAAATVLTLALGLGATTAVTSVLYTVVLAPAPYADPGALVQVVRVRDGRLASLVPPVDVQAVRSGATAFGGIAVSQFRDVALGGGLGPERVRGVIVTAETLPLLGVAPIAGRFAAAAQDSPGAPCVVVLSHAIATTRYAGANEVVGTDVRIDGVPCTVLAVMPPGFAFPAPYFAPGDVWLLAGPERVDWSATGGTGFLVFGRLRPGTTLDAARAEMSAIGEHAATMTPQRGDAGLTAVAYAASSRNASRPRLLTLLAAAALVLVIACVNVVNLQLARTAERTIEMAMRAAIGASRARLIRQLIAENLVLFAIAGVGGMIVAAWALHVIIGLRSFFIPRMEEASIDGIAVAVCSGLALVAGIGAGIYPAIRVSDLDSARTLAAAWRGATSSLRWRRFQRVLIGIETGLALVLLAGAVLLLRSYGRTVAIDPGLRTANVLHARVTPPAPRYPEEEALTAFYRRVEERAAAAPGILAVALTNVPPGAGAGAEQAFAIVGRMNSPGAWPRTVWRSVSDSYFATLEIPILRGGFQGHQAEPRVVIVNQEFARRFFDGADPLRQRLQMVANPSAPSPDDALWTIVGVAADARESYIHEPPPPAVYVRFTDHPARSMAILVRTAVEPLSAVPALQAAVAAVDPEQPVYGFRALDYILNSELDLNRLSMTLLTLFAGIALVLAVAGIYGVVAHSVGQRLREIGVRMALGAAARDVLRLIVGECAIYACVGIVVGLAVALPLAGRLENLAPGWAGVEASVFVAAAVTVMAVALISALLPARRAASLDPLDALRHD